MTKKPKRTEQVAFFDYEGRINRRQALVSFAACIPVGLLMTTVLFVMPGGLISDSGDGQPSVLEYFVLIPAVLIILYLQISLFIKRIHDIGFSATLFANPKYGLGGFGQLLTAACYIGLFMAWIYLVWLLFLIPSNLQDADAYGDKPKGWLPQLYLSADEQS